uniref:Uncharacterized protein n=1 Tax=Vespula pensylvanica TaxID=30213 RepID=A0A834NIU8_VESPE|nr:hypothetical protein H0235_013624 [Vespula pensylvanica]
MEVLVREIERDEEEQEGETEEERRGGEGEGGNKTEKRKVAGMAAVTVTVTVVSLLLTRMDARKNPQKCWKGMIESHQSFVNVQSDGDIRIKEREEKRS